ncbi:MAG: hypothetical protein M3283_07650 [Actinomycetota bacterium]|nr:hypothetical protein [Actinomycetota bacterium]
MNERTGILRTLEHDRLAPGLFSSRWRNRATEEQKRIGWETAVRIEKLLCPVLHEAHEQQVEETTNTLAEGRSASTRAISTELGDDQRHLRLGDSPG